MPALKLELQAAEARHPAARAGAPPTLQQLALRVNAGEQLAVIGPSGAGKTSLLQLLALALRPTAGRLLLDGADPWAAAPAARQRLRGQLFLAPQTPPLPPRQRVVTAVLAGALPALGLWTSLRSLGYPHDLPAAHAALAAFGLADKLFERVDRLSGGERQRVGLARALLSPARLWLMDEPLSALDPARAAQAMHTLCDQARQRGCTLLASLHQVDMALAHFERVVGLRDGRLVFDLPAAQLSPERLRALYAAPAHDAGAPSPAPLFPDEPDAPPATDAAPATRPALPMHCR